MHERLTREKWVAAGLATLGKGGPDAIAALRLAKQLGVSRGSFYWHFKSAPEFEAAILAAWEERWTSRVITTVEGGAADPRARLRLLIKATGGFDAEIYASAKRLARKNPLHGEVMRRIDERRTHFVATLLVAGGVAEKLALVRGRIIYAWAMGQMLTSQPGELPQKDVVDGLVRFAFGSPAEKAAT